VVVLLLVALKQSIESTYVIKLTCSRFESGSLLNVFSNFILFCAFSSARTLMAITSQHIAYLHVAALEIGALKILNILISVHT